MKKKQHHHYHATPTSVQRVTLADATANFGCLFCCSFGAIFAFVALTTPFIGMFFSPLTWIIGLVGFFLFLLASVVSWRETHP